MDEGVHWAERGAAAQLILDQLDPRRRWRVIDAGPGDDLGRIDIRGRDSGGGRWEKVSVHFLPSDPWHVTIERIASELQDCLVESRLPWGEAVPECPGTGTRPTRTTAGGEAVWVRPATRAVLRPILA